MEMSEGTDTPPPGNGELLALVLRCAETSPVKCLHNEQDRQERLPG